MDDYTEGDRWVWDQSDGSQYCKHGTFIGSWWGPDLMCWACEDGLTDAEYELACLYRTRHELRNRIQRIWPWEGMDIWNMLGKKWSHVVIDWLFKQAEEHGEYVQDLMDRLQAVEESIKEKEANEAAPESTSLR